MRWSNSSITVNPIAAQTSDIFALIPKSITLSKPEKPKSNLAVGTLQNFLNSFLMIGGAVKIDYVQGTDTVFDIGSEKGNVGFYLPSMNKNDLFKTVILDGALPRKTFSMGHSDEKRFYVEARKIV